ncbi:alginate export family protein [Candidatus Methylocalor cossyra]|uniref:alginate export family protein n=1 Tax=Candidatus Methylocalor cossyra TaxID=3108543 RepID=UPI0032B13805
MKSAFGPGKPPFTAYGSQRQDWLTGPRYSWPEFSAQRLLGLPDWLSMTLEQRTRYETMDASFAKGRNGSQYQIPLQTVLWLEARYQAFRAGVEFWDARQFGADRTSTLNTTMVDVADFTQIYGAWSTTDLLGSGLGFEIKGGRQTLDIGSRRLIARSSFRNTLNTFTGLSLRLRDGGGGWQLQAFAVQPVVRLPETRQGLLDNDYAWDQEQKNTFFTGFIADSAGLPFGSRGEIYLYYLEEDRSSPKNRHLYTPGLRLWRMPKKGELDYEAETIAQVGTARDSAKAEELPVEAYFEHIQLGYTFDLPWSPRFLAQYDYATGGTDGRLSRSFDTLYSARRFEYGPTGIFGAFARNNINSPGYRLFLTPRGDLSFYAAHRLFWLADATAPWGPANLVDKTGHSGDFIGHLVEVSGRWDVHPNLSLEAGWATLLKGRFARRAPGAPPPDDVNYFYVQSMVRF